MALTIDTPLPTPTGWTTVGRVQEGDYLYDEMGYPTKVTHVSDTYEVDTYVDVAYGWGRKARPEQSYLCSVDQEFYTLSYHRLYRLSNPHTRKDRTFKGMLERVPDNWPGWGYTRYNAFEKHTAEAITHTVKKRRSHGKRGYQEYYNHTTPTGFCLKNKDKVYDIHPYVMGVVLNYWNYEKKALRIMLGWYPFFRDHFKNLAGVDLVIHEESRGKTRNTAYVWCSYEGLEDLIPNNRVVPMEYLRGSEKDRVMLLRGLTDIMLYQHSSIRRSRSTIIFVHKYRPLTASVEELVRTLGYPAYRIYADYDEKSIYTRHSTEWHPPIPPSSHPKLIVRNYKNTLRVGHDLERYVWKVHKATLIEEKKQVKKITVDSPYGVYLAGKLFLPVVGETHGS